MAATTFEAHWIPDPVVVAADYDAMYVAFENRTAVMHEALQVVLRNTEEHFDQEGPGWAPWAPATAEDPRRGPLILTRSGALRSAATSEGSYEVNREFILWTGAEAPSYWGFHWAGTSRMPQRNFIGLDSAGEDEVVAVFDAWMDSVASIGAGGGGGFGMEHVVSTPSGLRIRSSLGTFLPYQ